ncbi:intermembrane phospholipid transport protein YdbH family protein [Pseudodesulfovibrio sediminis]|uniref:Dicarboxylate transport domain-containing protein n=1 Tax=Pseudodesulfovibrio sediminis TaxID=2810563 RepID=A0ABN6EVN0_9BACT|nr:YdbH domain-containing protein [Pseudodesulfovibrio sediminis]BCS89537.1 hypothetical protein PSDVSF_27790 [Pseudodesulfovibrio sediminis]
MSAALGKRVLKWTLLITPWLLALLLAAGWGLTVWTPGYLEKLVPQLAAEMAIPLTEFQIRNAGLFSADIGPVQIGEGNNSVRLANVHVTYTPASLKQGQVNSVELDGVTLSCQYDGTTLIIPALDLLPQSQGDASANNAIPDLPFERLVLRDSTLHCDIKGEPLSIPFSATISPGTVLDFQVDLSLRDQAVEVTGSLGPTLDDLGIRLVTPRFRLGALADFMPIPISGDMALDCSAVVDLANPGMLTADFDATMTQADLSGLNVTLKKDEAIHLKGSLADKEITFSMDEVAVAAPYPATVGIRYGMISSESLSAQFTLDGAGAKMGGRFDANRNGELWDVSLTAANPENITLNIDGRQLHLATLIFSLQGTATPEQADMVLNCATKGAALGNTGFRSGPLRLTLPLKWPAPERHTPGTVTMHSLRMDKRMLGNVSATVRQQGTNVTYNGVLKTNLLPGLRVRLSGLTSLVSSNVTAQFAIKDYALPKGFTPSSIVPDAGDMTVAGKLNVNGAVKVDIDGVQSTVQATFSDGEVLLAGGQTSISGINLSFNSPELHPLRSGPAQELTFTSLKSGAIDVTNGKIIYQLEPGGIILFEQAGFNWAGGHVSSRAFRITPGSQKYDITMFCSELKLSAILAQLGLAQAEGEASLSGELPVSWERGKITFNKGFLHSTPGESGTIQVEAMADLVAAIPEGTPQRGQIELAQAAVKNFEYKWVRIKADTVGEDLVVRLSVDGKPAGTLPFVYKKEFGGFMKVTGNVQGSNFQGIRLDVNFSVPLDRILLYKDIVNMIE